MAPPPQGRSGCGCLPVLLGPLLFAALGAVGAAPATVAYLQLTQPARLRENPIWWALAAAAPLVAVAVVGCATSGPILDGVGSMLRRAATLFAATTAVALVIFVGWGRGLDAHGPGRSAMAAALGSAVVSLVGILVLRRLAPRRPDAAAAGRRAPQARGGGRPHRRQAPKSPQPAPKAPRRGEIWWGTVPFRHYDGSTRRPFLVLNVTGGAVTGLPITRNDYTYRDDYLPFEPDARTADLGPGSVSLAPRTLRLDDVGARAGTPCPRALWRMIDARFPATASQRRPPSR
jgi:hypothetical protein